MTIEIIRDRHELLGYREQWNGVSKNYPMQSWEWCVNWLTHLATDTDPYVIIETDGQGTWQTVVPMASCKTIFGENKVFSMGCGEACTDYTGLINATKSQSCMSASKFAFMLTSLRENPNQRVEVVEFDGVEVNSEETLKLVSEMEHSGYQTHCMPLESSWKLDLESDWQTLNARFSKKHRRKTKKAIQRLDESEFSIQFGTESDEFEVIWQVFSDLHQQRRGMLDQVGCFANSKFEQFLKTATQQLMQRGLAEIIQISFEHRPIASALLFHDTRTAFMYQTGFDPETKHLEPGYLMIVSSLHWAIEKGFETFDFLRGDEPYKARWQTVPVELAKLRFVDLSTIGARVRDNLWSNYRAAKSTAKTVKERLRAAQ